jgi:predicted transcriptional regulator
MTDTKAMTLRLDRERAAELEAIAASSRVPVSEEIREAIDEHVERRRQDAEFLSRLQRFRDRDREIRERLANT